MSRAGWETIANEDSLLLDYARRLNKFRKGRRAVWVFVSRLRPHNRRDHHMRIAVSTFDTLIRKFDGALFRLFNEDLVVVCNGAKMAEIDDCVLRLRYLFSEDPLFKGGEGGDDDAFCAWFDMEQDYPKFLSQVERSAEARTRFEAQQAAEAADRKTAPQAALPPLEAAQLSTIVTSLLNADISSMLRRQPVCVVVPGEKPEVLFNELYISIDSLRQLLMPGRDIAANRWLFQELTRHLDQRMLALLRGRNDAALHRAFSVNLNVETILSPGFLEFEAALNGTGRRTIVVELQLFDALADVATFQFARDFLHDRGYRLCVDGASDLSLPLIDRERLGVDLVKLKWSEDLLERLGEDGTLRLRQAVESLGPERLILCHCDSEHAVTFGRSLGINMFQGFHIDRLASATPTRQEAVRAMTDARARHRAATRHLDRAS